MTKSSIVRKANVRFCSAECQPLNLLSSLSTSLVRTTVPEFRKHHTACVQAASGVPRNFVRWGGGSTNSVEDRGQRQWGSGGGSPLVRGSGGSCNLVQEILFHIVKFS